MSDWTGDAWIEAWAIGPYRQAFDAGRARARETGENWPVFWPTCVGENIGFAEIWVALLNARLAHPVAYLKAHTTICFQFLRVGWEPDAPFVEAAVDQLLEIVIQAVAVERDRARRAQLTGAAEWLHRASLVSGRHFGSEATAPKGKWDARHI